MRTFKLSTGYKKKTKHPNCGCLPNRINGNARLKTKCIPYKQPKYIVTTFSKRKAKKFKNETIRFKSGYGVSIWISSVSVEAFLILYLDFSVYLFIIIIFFLLCFSFSSHHLARHRLSAGARTRASTSKNIGCERREK